MPIKKTTKLPTVKEKLASLANKRPDKGILSGKAKSQNSIGKKVSVSKLETSFDWYGAAKKRFSLIVN